MKSISSLAVVFGLVLCASAFANSDNAAPKDRDDTEFRCKFEDPSKKDGMVCYAWGRFDSRRPSDTAVHWGDRDDGLKIVCHHNGTETNLFTGEIGVQLRPDAGDTATMIDTRFIARNIGAIRYIDVEDYNWLTGSGTFRSQLSYGVLPNPLSHLSGVCEFRRPYPPAPSAALN